MSSDGSMRYITINAFGGPEVMSVTSGPRPKPGPNEVLVKVSAAGVNRPDVAQRQGAYPPPPGASAVLGLEVAGQIAANMAAKAGFLGWGLDDRGDQRVLRARFRLCHRAV